MDGALTGLSALVTGGSGAIGSASALALLRDGAAVLLLARGADALERARGSLLAEVPDGRVTTFAGDGCSERDVAAAASAAAAMTGRLDIVVATVGQAGTPRPVTEETPQGLRDVFERNVVSALLTIRHAAPLMTAGGSVVCISSTVARRVSAGSVAYAAAKGALESLVMASAEDLAPLGIRINAVRPGPVKSRLRKAFYANPDIAARFLAKLPLGRLGEGADIGAAVRWLAGPESAWVTGQSMAVDGGSELRGQPDFSGLSLG